MPIPSQFAFIHSSEKIFIRPNGLPGSVPHFLICNMISVGDAQKSSKVSHFCSLYLSNSAVRVHVSQVYGKIEMTS